MITGSSEFVTACTGMRPRPLRPNTFGDDDAAEEGRDVDAELGHNRDERGSQAVAVDDPALAQAPGPLVGKRLHRISDTSCRSH